MPSRTVAAITQRYSTHSVRTTPSSSSGPGSASPRHNTASATNAVTIALAQFAVTMIRLRSKRSVITPAGSVKSSHGSRWATATSAMRIGFRVTADASHG